MAETGEQVDVQTAQTGEPGVPKTPIASEAQDKEAIQEILSADGVRDVVDRFGERFKTEPGKSYIHGITPNGLVVAVREGATDDAFKPGYFKAWVLDATLPADRIEEEMIQAEFSYNSVERLRDGGTTFFPSALNKSFLEKYAGKSDDEIKAAVPSNPSAVSLVRFYEKTGGFYVPRPQDSANELPSAGNQHIYPIQ